LLLQVEVILDREKVRNASEGEFFILVETCIWMEIENMTRISFHRRKYMLIYEKPEYYEDEMSGTFVPVGGTGFAEA